MIAVWPHSLLLLVGAVVVGALAFWLWMRLCEWAVNAWAGWWAR